MKLTRGFKLLVALLITGGIVYTFYSGIIYRVIPQRAAKDSVTIDKNIDFSSGPQQSPGSASQGTSASGSGAASSYKGDAIRFQGLTWMAQAGLHYAMGGETTVPGSIFDKYGVKMTFVRDDDVPHQKEMLVKFAVQYCSQGKKNPTDGYHFVSIMGDSAKAFLAEPLAAIERLGNGCSVSIIGSYGRSFGEDSLWGPREWKDDPSKARGGLVAGVVGDGDWDVMIKWVADNKDRICYNPDETTYDPNCLNVLNTNSFEEADNKFITGHVESRAEVRNGKKTGKTVQRTVDGVLTWTPGDVTVAKEKGGLVRIASTREYRWMMPHVIIGNKGWMRENQDLVDRMLMAGLEGSYKVKTSEAAFKKAMAIVNDMYKQPNTSPEWWAKYFNGVTERDKLGELVELGGSAVNDLDDNLVWFGMKPGGEDLYKRSYDYFGSVFAALYPERMKTGPSYEKVMDKSYLKRVSQKMQDKGRADMPTFGSGDVKSVISKRSWQVTFKTGSADFTTQALAELENMFTSIASTGQAVEVHGYTDNVGSSAVNMPLSARRANAVKQWLKDKSPLHFPESRFGRVEGHGASNFIASNDTEYGRSQNRRVEIVLGSK